MRTSVEQRGDSLRLLLVVALWGGAFWLLASYGAALLPRSIARQVTLEAYLAVVQLVTLGIGAGLASALLHRPREDLALTLPSARSIERAIALSPAVFVVATGLAFQIARPILLDELRRGGLALAQRSTGEFGRELTQAPLALTFVWGALVSPASEELFFRGALWSLAQRAVARVGAVRGAPPSSLSPELLEDGTIVRLARGAARWLREGGAATLAVALLFGALHHDMPGGLGVVRFVSALGLGLACGIARQRTQSVVPPLLLHIAFNALSLATVRRLVVTATFPMRSGVPTLVAAAAVVGVAIVMVGYFARRRV